MAVLTTLAQLEEVQTAITQILTNGQSYALQGRALSRADLEGLQKREDTLLSRYRLETAGGNTNYARFKRPV